MRENPGVPVSLDKDEYMELDTEPQAQKNPAVGEVPERDIRLWEMLCNILNGSGCLLKLRNAYTRFWHLRKRIRRRERRLVVYQGMYPPFKICARPYDMFMSEDESREKYRDDLGAKIPI